MAAAMPRRRT
ncbi:MAG: hypothetical protein FJW35_13395 [Acidobacteria bacterium]|nr:hypothetical protein [Acidobacteriota bacterium]